MVDIVASVRCRYKVGMRRRPYFHQLPTWAQRIFAICVVTPNTKYDVRWYCSRIPSILAPGWERGGGILIFSNIRRPGPFLGITFWYSVMTPKDIHKIFIPQTIFIFLKTLKGIEIQNFEPQNGASLRMNENIIVPPPPRHPLLADRNRGRGGGGGVQTQITEKKNSDKGIYCWFFFCNYIIFFLRFKRVETFIGGGGGGVQLFIIIIFFFFFWGGGGGGVQILISIETYITCDFSGGGGGVRSTYPSLDSRKGKK